LSRSIYTLYSLQPKHMGPPSQKAPVLVINSLRLNHLFVKAGCLVVTRKASAIQSKGHGFNSKRNLLARPTPPSEYCDCSSFDVIYARRKSFILLCRLTEKLFGDNYRWRYFDVPYTRMIARLNMWIVHTIRVKSIGRDCFDVLTPSFGIIII